ncbi:MAG: DUF4430 domain-containing protein [Promethearchaeota archaeon]
MIALVLVMNSINTSLAQPDTNNITAAEGITLTVDFGNGTIIDYNNLNGSSVLNVTSSVLDVEVEWFGPFAYIRGIEGLSGEGAEGWEYWVNGEFASIAVNLYTLEDGDSILWKYTSPEPQTQPQYDPTFIPGVIIVALSGMGFIAIIYVQTSRRIK